MTTAHREAGRIGDDDAVDDADETSASDGDGDGADARVALASVSAMSAVSVAIFGILVSPIGRLCCERSGLSGRSRGYIQGGSHGDAQNDGDEAWIE